MSALQRVFSLVMLVSMLVSGSVLTPGPSVLAQGNDATTAGFVSGPVRVMVLQTVIGEEVPDAGLAKPGQGTWVVMIADVTNTGVSAVFDPSQLQLGTTTESLLSMTNGIAADTANSISVTQALALPGVSAEATFPVAENGTSRLAFVFQLPGAPGADDRLVLRLNDQVMSVSNTVVESLAIAQLPALVPEMALQVADITAAVGGGKVDVALRAGGTATVDMDGVVAPVAEASISSSCYSGETATQTMNLTGGTVWIEQVPGGESLVWFNDPAAANFGLLNAHLVAGGFAGVDANSSSPYLSWLGSVQELAQSQNTGLWSVCKDAEGAWINQPAPTPMPTQSPEQVRAQYQWIDTRDLVIRPGEFEGDKIAVAGTVFNIDVDGNFTAMQIWLDGGSEAAVIIYEGDSRGIYEGTWVTVYGTGAGTFEGTNAFGGTISQPVIAADIVDF